MLKSWPLPMHNIARDVYAFLCVCVFCPLEVLQNLLSLKLNMDLR